MSEPEQRRAEVVPLRASDTHYELALDDEPPPGPAVPVDSALPERGTTLLPVIPRHLSTVAGVRAHARRQAALHRHRLLYHGVRSPRYLALIAVYAVAGVFRVLGRQLRWWWALELHSLLGQSVAAGDDRAALRLHKEAKATRRFRGYVLLGELAAVLAVSVALAVYSRWQADALAAIVAAVLLARAGRPRDKPIVTPAAVTPRFRKLSADIVLRAYYSAQLGHPDKPDQQVTFGSPMAREGEGSGVDVDLPYGKGLDDALKAKPGIASGLDVQVSQVFLHRDPTSHRRHHLWVADRDPLAVSVGRTPLLACRQTDIWKPAPFGLDERGQLVSVLLMWVSVLVSALPRSGKTFAARLLALYAALDPFVKLDVFDFKGSPDWRKFALVADSCAFGLTPSRAGNPLQIFGETLESVKADVQDRYHRLSELPPEICPEGKLTRKIARDPRYRMPVRMLFMDEFQEVYDLPEQAASKEVAGLLTYLVKVAPGAGVILVGSTQRPSGVGSGQVASQFTSFRDNFAVRFGLRTSSWQVSELCLGAGAYSEGLDTSTLLPQYRGVGILRGASDASPTVRTYLADGQDAEKILRAARTLREQAGTLSGMAAGEDAGTPPRDVLADVLSIFGGDSQLHWEMIASRLGRQFPDRWAEASAEAVSAECRALGVRSADVRYPAGRLGTVRKGCYRRDVEGAAARGTAGQEG